MTDIIQKQNKNEVFQSPPLFGQVVLKHHGDSERWKHPPYCALPECRPTVCVLSGLWIQHDFAGASQLSQFDPGVFCSVQGHLTVFPGRVCGALVGLACGNLQGTEREGSVVKGRNVSAGTRLHY